MNDPYLDYIESELDYLREEQYFKEKGLSLEYNEQDEFTPAIRGRGNKRLSVQTKAVFRNRTS